MRAVTITIFCRRYIGGTIVIDVSHPIRHVNVGHLTQVSSFDQKAG